MLSLADKIKYLSHFMDTHQRCPLPYETSMRPIFWKIGMFWMNIREKQMDDELELLLHMYNRVGREYIQYQKTRMNPSITDKDYIL